MTWLHTRTRRAYLVIWVSRRRQQVPPFTAGRRPRGTHENGIQGALYLAMQDELTFPDPMDDVDYNAWTARVVAGQEAYYNALPVPRAPEVTDAMLDAWERRHDPTL